MDDLYRDEILEHYRRPHNFGTLPEPDAVYEGANPLCGDRITLMLGISDDGHRRRRRLHRARLRHQPGVGVDADRRDQGPAAGRDRDARPARTSWTLLGIEISPARLKCALLSLDTLQPGARRPRRLAGHDRGRRRMTPAVAARIDPRRGPLQVSAAGLTGWPTPVPDPSPRRPADDPRDPIPLEPSDS